MVNNHEFYNENGYLIIKNLIPKHRINSVLENIFKLYCRYSKDVEDLHNKQHPWETEQFHKKLIEFRKTNPKEFGAIYDSLKTSVSVIKLVTDDDVVTNSAKLLNVELSDLSNSEPMCRLDAPEDARNVINWHQERAYFPQNRDGLNGLVCWIPLADSTEEMGTIHICPKSHQDGLMKVNPKNKDSELKTTQITVPEENVKKFDDVIVSVNAGDAVFFNMLLFHRSGHNSSNRFRFSVQARFHKATAEDFIPFELINYYNPDIKKKVEEKYDCSDIPNNKRQPPVAQYYN